MPVLKYTQEQIHIGINIIYCFSLYVNSYSEIFKCITNEYTMDAMSVILESLLAYLLLGEVFSEPTQWIGFFLIITGLIVMNIGKSSYN
jgi:uncharacterized membrane protein